MLKNWTVYILECADKTLYTGITSDLERRLQEHGTAKGARYTRGRGPFKLRYFEAAGSRAEASRREAAIKSMSRQEKLQLIG